MEEMYVNVYELLYLRCVEYVVEYSSYSQWDYVMYIRNQKVYFIYVGEGAVQGLFPVRCYQFNIIRF